MPILKIITDTPASLFIDKRYVGEIDRDSVFPAKVDIGQSLLEFKTGDCLLKQEIISIDNDNSVIHSVTLADSIAALNEENYYLAIRNSHAYVIKNEDGTADMVNETFSTKTRINAERFDFYSRGPKNGEGAFCEFDKAGLIPVNNGGHPDDIMGYFTIGGRYGAANKKGDIQVPIIFDKPIRFENEHTTVAQFEGKSVFINSLGEKAFENVFDSVKNYVGNYCVVEKGGLYGVIDYHGDLIFSIEFANIILIYDNGYDNSRLQRFSVPPLTFEDNIKEFEREKNIYFCITSDRGSCILNGNLKQVYPEYFQSAEPMTNSREPVWRVKLNNKFGIYSFNKDCYLPIEYDSIKAEGSFLSVCKGDKFGIYYLNHEIVPVEYRLIKRKMSFIRHEPIFQAYKNSNEEPVIYSSNGCIITDTY